MTRRRYVQPPQPVTTWGARRARRSTGPAVRVAAIGAVVVVAAALLVMNRDDPSTAEDESRSCDQSRLNETCLNGHPMCPAPNVCPTEVSTTSVVTSIVDQATETTQVPTLATVASDTTVVAVVARPNSEAAPKPTDAAPQVEAPVEVPATEPPAEPPAHSSQLPDPNGVDPTSCTRPVQIQAGEWSWSMLADRVDVRTQALKELNGVTDDVDRLAGAWWCAPPSEAGDSGPAATTPAPGTTAPAPPTTAGKTPQAPATTTPQTTTTERRSPSGQRTTTTAPAPTPTTADQRKVQEVPKQPQASPTTTTAPQVAAPPSTRVAPGTVRTTVPGCSGC